MNRHTRRQHFVPAFWLKQFADQDGKVTVHDREQRKEWSAAPTEIGLEKDFYSVAIPGVPPDAGEKALAQIEADAAPAMQRLASGTFPLAAADKGALATLFAAQFQRGREPRHRLDRHFADIAQKIGAIVAANATDEQVDVQLRDLGVEPTTVRDRRGALERATAGAEGAKLPVEFYVKLILEPLAELQPFFEKRVWLLVEGADFALPDEPIMLLQNDQHWLYGPGLATANELRVAISPTLALCMVDPPELARVEYGPERRFELNRDQMRVWQEMFWVQSHRYVFRNPGTPNIGATRAGTFAIA